MESVFFELTFYTYLYSRMVMCLKQIAGSHCLAPGLTHVN